MVRKEILISLTGMVEVVRKEILISLLQVWWRWCVKRSSYHCYMFEVVRKEITELQEEVGHILDV